MVDWWTEWLRRAETGDYNSEFPDFPSPSLENAVDPKFSFASKVAGFTKGGFVAYHVRDLRKTKLLPARVLVSRKRTSNLYDLASTWKKSVVHTMETMEDEQVATTSGIRRTQDDMFWAGIKEKPMPGDLEYINFQLDS
ncbi:hypothetical protein L218DRAFT_1008935 [Marasmius fiardii PR-910]|nr:hypothetical protein L218DRAFT_1008935 [Marasmius fiardii PR-910]